MTAIAEEPEDKSAKIYSSYCVNCHGERVEKIPLNADSTLEQKVKAINLGVDRSEEHTSELQSQD